MVSPEYLKEFRKRWDEIMLGKTGDKISIPVLNENGV
jgi:hypothetical protein